MRTKNCKITVLAAILALLCAMGVLFQTAALNVQAAEQTILESDSTAASEGCVFLGLEGKYLAGAQEALERINEIRYEACLAGDVPDPRNASRMLTEADYVPIKWSSDLEQISRIRAAEAAVTIDHARLNGKSIWTVSSNGVRSYGEVLAWNWSQNVVTGVNQWYGEKADWVNQNSAAVTGHYTSMINPSNLYVGVAAFYSKDTHYGNTTAGSFTSLSSALDQSMLEPTETIVQKLDVYKADINDIELGAIYEGETTVPDPILVVAGCRFHALDPLVYQSADSSLLSVSADGKLTGKKRGKTTLTIDIGSGLSLTKEVQVECRHDYVLSEVNEAGQVDGTCTKCGDTFTATVPTSYSVYWRNTSTGANSYYMVLPSENPEGSQLEALLYSINGDAGYQDLVIESSDENVVKIGETSGNITKLQVVGTGLVTITLYPKYNPDLKKTYTGFVGNEGGIDLQNAEISLSRESYTETGRACEPSVTVTYHGITLRNGTQYSVEYQDNISAGEAKVLISGKGYFGGTVEKTYQISHDLSLIEEKAATCTDAGNRAYWHCGVCDRNFGKEDGTEALAEGSWIIPAPGHMPLADAAVAPTCTEEGLTEGSHCEVCGEVLAEQEVVPALGHTPVADEAKAATCTEEGLTEGSHCEVCGEVLAEQEVVPALGHTPVTDEAKAATCTEEGLTEGSHCEVCGEILAAQDIVPATGHTPAPAVVENASERICGEPSTFDEVIYCKICGEELSRERKSTEALPHSPIILPAVEPACTETGLTEGSSCSNCGEILVAQDVIPATGHTPVMDAAKEPTCTEEGLTEGSHCEVCGEILTKQQIIPAKGHTPVTDEAVAPTTKAEGLTEGSHCEVCGEVLVAQKVVAKLTTAVQKKAGKITKVTASKTLKYKKLKKKSQTFKLSAKAAGNAKITYSLSKVTRQAGKYIKISKAGKVTVKKGLKKGTYKIKVKVTATATKTYKKAVVNKTITLKIK